MFPHTTLVFPFEFIKKCIKTYEKEHGKYPKLLVMSESDLLEYKLNRSIEQVRALKVKILGVKWLKSGEFELAMGIEGRDIDKEE